MEMLEECLTQKSSQTIFLCPYCGHKPYIYKKALYTHLTNVNMYDTEQLNCFKSSFMYNSVSICFKELDQAIFVGRIFTQIKEKQKCYPHFKSRHI